MVVEWLYGIIIIFLRIVTNNHEKEKMVITWNHWGNTINYYQLYYFQILSDENKLTSEERTWINSNINNVQNIYVAKDENLFSKDGNGVFYDFLEDFETEYGLKINVVTFENSNPDGINLNNIDLVTTNSNVFYTDHYVLVSKNLEIIKSYDDLKDKTIGVLNKDLDYLKSYL